MIGDILLSGSVRPEADSTEAHFIQHEDRRACAVQTRQRRAAPLLGAGKQAD
jgi:hypothetical protein